MITQQGGKWCAKSASGDVTFGCYATEGEARERLRQVEAAKAAKAAKGDAKKLAPVTVIRRLATDSRGERVKRVDYVGTFELVASHADALARACDGLSVYKTPEGFVRGYGRINGCGVYEYMDQAGNRWGELRLPEHVFAPEVLEAWKLVPLTDDHPDGFVTAENVDALACGTIGSDVQQVDDHTVADIAINTAAAVAKLERGKIGLSCGYETTRIESAGIYNGVPYRFIQTEIVPNHVSLVDAARGPGCEFIIDGVRPVTGDTTMSKKNTRDAKIMVGEAEHEVPDAVAVLVQELQAKIEEQGAMLAKLQAEPAADEDMPVESEPAASSSAAMAMDGLGKRAKGDDAKALEARLAFLENQRQRSDADFGAAVSRRVALVTDAAQVLGKTDGLESMTDSQIKAAVVFKIAPGMKGKLDTKSIAAVDAAYALALDTHRNADSSAPLREALGHAALAGGKTNTIDLNKLANDSAGSLAPSRAR